jgi:hypothetical protein
MSAQAWVSRSTVTGFEMQRVFPARALVFVAEAFVALVAPAVVVAAGVPDDVVELELPHPAAKSAREATPATEILASRQFI